MQLAIHFYGSQKTWLDHHRFRNICCLSLKVVCVLGEGGTSATPTSSNMWYACALTIVLQDCAEHCFIRSCIFRTHSTSINNMHSQLCQGQPKIGQGLQVAPWAAFGHPWLRCLCGEWWWEADLIRMTTKWLQVTPRVYKREKESITLPKKLNGLRKVTHPHYNIHKRSTIYGEPQRHTTSATTRAFQTATIQCSQRTTH